MSKTLNEKIENLNTRINGRIFGNQVEFDGKHVSLYEFRQVLKKGFGKYNTVLLDELEKTRKSINKRIALSKVLNKKIPYISEMIPVVYEDGKREIDIYFEVDDKCKGIAAIQDDLSIDFDFLKRDYSIGATQKLLKAYEPTFAASILALNSFVSEYPNTAYIWDRNNEIINTQIVDDGFIHAKLDLNNLDYADVSLSQMEDLQLSIIKTKKYGELNDFVAFYGKAISKRTPVDLYELNPLFFQIFKKNCGYGQLIEDQPKDEKPYNPDSNWSMVMHK